MAKKKKYHPGGGVPPRKPIVQDGDRTAPLRRVRPPRPADGGPDGRTPPPLRRVRPPRPADGGPDGRTPPPLRKRVRRRGVGLSSDAEKRALQRQLLQSMRDNALTTTETRRRGKNPSMPTAGMDARGRNIRGTTPMPGPAPDAARMRRMQKLMEEARKRFFAERRGALGNTRVSSPVDKNRKKNAAQFQTKNIKNVYEDFMSRTGRGPTGTGTPRPKNPQKLKKAEPRTGGGMPRPTRRRR